MATEWHINRSVTRRDFLRGTVSAALAAAMGFPLQDAKADLSNKTKVVLVRDNEAIDKRGRINAQVIRQMLDEAVATLLGKEDPVEAWRLLIKPSDIVGIKSNEWGPLPTPREAEEALKSRIINAGVAEGNIGIDDRGVLGNPIFLRSTALVNVRPLRTHHWAGVGGCIKNYIMFTPRPPEYHPDSCADLGALWRLPIVKNKTRLNVLLLLTPLFHGIGPHHFDRTYSWPYQGILVGTDPVAVDAVGLRIFELKRLAYFDEDVPLRPPAKHIALADAQHKLGTSDLRDIELVKLGWVEGVLI